MKLLYVAKAIIALVVFVSCTQDITELEYCLIHSEKNLLSGDEIYPEIQLMSPRQLYFYNNHLLLLDTYDNKHLTVIDLADGSSSRYLNLGNGPYDYLRVAGIYAGEDKTTLRVFDERKRKAFSYRLTEAVDLDNGFIVKEDTLGMNHNLFTVIPFEDRYIASGCFKDGMLAIVTPDATVETTFGSYPGDCRLIGTQEFAIKNQMTIATDLSGRVVVAAGIYNDWLAFYKYHNGTFKLQKDYFSKDSMLDVICHKNDVAEYYSSKETSETIRHYKTLYSTQEYLYALYWGISSKSLDDTANHSYVLKFRHDGTFVDGYKTYEMLKSIAVSDNDEKMYALTCDAETRLLEYLL